VGICSPIVNAFRNHEFGHPQYRDLKGSFAIAPSVTVPISGFPTRIMMLTSAVASVVVLEQIRVRQETIYLII